MTWFSKNFYDLLLYIASGSNYYILFLSTYIFLFWIMNFEPVCCLLLTYKEGTIHRCTKHGPPKRWNAKVFVWHYKLALLPSQLCIRTYTGKEAIFIFNSTHLPLCKSCLLLPINANVTLDAICRALIMLNLRPLKPFKNYLQNLLK